MVFLVALPAFYGLNAIAQVPSRQDHYFALYTLGAARTAEHYFPNDQTDILPGVQMSWFVGVYNHMGAVQVVRVVIRILNDTMPGPNQLNATPSQVRLFFEKTRLLLSNETWVLPLVWSVQNATISGTDVTIHSIIFNGNDLTNNIEVSASYGYNFRIVIELWVFDDVSGTFSFQWTGNDGQHVAWNQLWFNMTKISLLPS